MDYTVFYSYLNFYLEFWIIALVFRGIIVVVPVPLRQSIEYVGLKTRYWIHKSVLQGFNVSFYEEEEFFIEHSKMDSFGHLILIYILAPAFVALYIGPMIIVYGFKIWADYQFVGLLFTVVGFSLLAFAIPTTHDLAKVGDAAGKSVSIWILKGVLWITFIELIAKAEILHETFLWWLLTAGIVYPGRSIDLDLMNSNYNDLITTLAEVK